MAVENFVNSISWKEVGVTRTNAISNGLRHLIFVVRMYVILVKCFIYPKVLESDHLTHRARARGKRRRCLRYPRYEKHAVLGVPYNVTCVV